MPIATDQQVQRFVSERFRPRAEQARALYLACKDDKAAIDDVYAAVAQETPTWSDDRPDGPPHLLTPSDVLAYNTFLDMLIAFIEGTLTDGNKNTGAAQWPVMQDACVQPVNLV